MPDACLCAIRSIRQKTRPIKISNESLARLFYLEKNESRMNGDSANAKIVSPQGIPLNGAGPAMFHEQTSCFSVQVPMGFLKNWKERKHAKTAQVWLLKTDGTMVPPCARPFVFSMGTLGDHATDYQFHTFPKVPADDLASVVVSCGGRLYCHEIRKSGGL